MEFLQSIDWMQLLRAFIVGGLICIIGQLLIDKTKLTSARILVTFVTVGVILGALGIYQYYFDRQDSTVYSHGQYLYPQCFCT